MAADLGQRETGGGGIASHMPPPRQVPADLGQRETRGGGGYRLRTHLARKFIIRGMPRQRHYRNPPEPGICVFVTTTILDFVPVFREPAIADRALLELARVHRKERARLHSFVIMPEHMHFLTTLPPDKNSMVFVGMLKSRMADVILPKLSASTRSMFEMQLGLNRRTFWQRSFRGYAVEGEDVFWQKANYIHLNPVRRELVPVPEAYRWSSARLFLRGHWRDERGLTFEMTDLDD